MANNLEADSTYIYDRSAPVSGTDPLPAIIPTGTIFVATVNGATGAVSFSGTTGLTFTGAGSTVTVAGTLAVANGGTGATNAGDARANLVAAKSGVNTDITQLNNASQVDVSSAYLKSGAQVVGARKTGWTVPTGTATRTGFDTATATTTQLAEALKALIDDLHATAGHGLLGT